MCDPPLDCYRVDKCCPSNSTGVITQYHIPFRVIALAFVTSALTALSRLLGAFLYKNFIHLKCCIIWKFKLQRI